MSGEIVPKPGDLRASHEDRDQVVEQLRVAAGDGRLSSEELDDRLEAALTARTYAELELLLVDLPGARGAAGAATAAAPTVPAAAPAKELVRMTSRGGNISRTGAWTVPRRLELEATGGNIVIDFTQAVLSAPLLDLDVKVYGGNLRLIVPPEVAVDVDDIDMLGGNVHRRVRGGTGAPVPPLTLRVSVTGAVTGGNVVVQSPRKPGRWARLFRRRH
ncbi:hypothetical protein P3T36_007346 [Kitasatospora sp. MAP12-15]|uniref:DUF1707 SHOCT-like domain-containing protein n=1 Tax=unclassified Kitasatospora TaxID=2633591 RepID=UPI002475A246|nr:DUF1707 domain-containing protein [Kitasatospora sp. MAP12-44]MDH6115057.1 hypothetical protein [Kitasatospora sp. MAP12-44]